MLLSSTRKRGSLYVHGEFARYDFRTSIEKRRVVKTASCRLVQFVHQLLAHAYPLLLPSIDTYARKTALPNTILQEWTDFSFLCMPHAYTKHAKFLTRWNPASSQLAKMKSASVPKIHLFTLPTCTYTDRVHFVLCCIAYCSACCSAQLVTVQNNMTKIKKGK